MLLKKMFGTTFAAAAITALSTMFAGSAQAATFNVGGTAYDITVVGGSFDQNAALLTNQPWWGSNAIASQFAIAVGSQLGLGNGVGPLFVTDAIYWNQGGVPRVDVGAVYFVNGNIGSLGSSGPLGGFNPQSLGYVGFASATPVNIPNPPESIPEPSSVLSLVALGIGAMTMRRKLPSSKTAANLV